MFKQMNKMTLTTNTELFRYDVQEPPTAWSNDVKNPEYVFDDRPKNMFGGLFFYKTRELSIKTGEQALKIHPDEYNDLWITHCHLTRDVNLLDLSQYPTISSALLDMTFSGFYILNDNFHKEGLQDRPSYAELYADVVRLRLLTQDGNWFSNPQKRRQVNDCISHIEAFFYRNDRLDVFGQRLTDFGNGPHFKRLLELFQYDGYTFNESGGIPGAETICVLSSDYLSAPQKEKVI